MNHQADKIPSIGRKRVVVEDPVDPRPCPPCVKGTAKQTRQPLRGRRGQQTEPRARQTLPQQTPINLLLNVGARGGGRRGADVLASFLVHTNHRAPGVWLVGWWFFFGF